MLDILKRLAYVLFLIFFIVTLLLSLFEVTILWFHSPLNTIPFNASIRESTWLYLLKQHYVTFIDIDAYTIQEKRHLLDVKRSLEEVYQLWLFLLGFVFLGFKVIAKHYQIFLYRSSILGLTVLFILLLSLFDFLENFKFLHSLVFLENTWIFPKNSLLIELFPLHYFQEFLVLVVLQSFILFLVLYFVNKKH